MARNGNGNLHDSARNKQDEFYTNLQLIEDELKHYRAHFRGKRILCNCDDPWESNFFKFFAMNFNALGLKSLTATCYATSSVAQMELDLFGNGGGRAKGASLPCDIGRDVSTKRPKRIPYKIVITEVKDENGDGRVDWFDVVNTAGEKLTAQERRNAIYAGPWLEEAKKYFSKTGCPAVVKAEKYMNGSAIRQQILETALGWIADRDGIALEDYMAAHQHDADCADLWSYFEAVVAWVGTTFPNTRAKLMKGLPWGLYYNKFGHVPQDAAVLEARIAKLLRYDEDVGDITNQRGIYEYLLDGDERHLSIRAFSPKMARTAYERQAGVCPICDKYFDLEAMEADHIVPWSKGDRTVADNCQMLCRDCNRRKGAK